MVSRAKLRDGFQQQHVATSTSSIDGKELQPMEHPNEGVIWLSRSLGDRGKWI